MIYINNITKACINRMAFTHSKPTSRTNKYVSVPFSAFGFGAEQMTWPIWYSAGTELHTWQYQYGGKTHQ